MKKEDSITPAFDPAALGADHTVLIEVELEAGEVKQIIRWVQTARSSLQMQKLLDKLTKALNRHEKRIGNYYN